MDWARATVTDGAHAVAQNNRSTTAPARPTARRTTARGGPTVTDRTEHHEDLSRYPHHSLFGILPTGRVDAAMLALRDAGYASDGAEVLRDEHADDFRAGAESGGLRRHGGYLFHWFGGLTTEEMG